ncbi:P2Y purinoceptor 6-like isoform X1 [Phyllopteryx taeniolatus]|uniref:P2Y purinoceptor 6-like isoform X1 n=1 Tax=Phyllopteryx taeniolatus TaxID=161469 RepID=UPI002AD34A63|nr:P2Y purinoceptor 6-like isoform X1 [Phyllopteryx taeniolatus]
MGWSPTSNETTPAVAAGTPQTPPSCSVDESYKYVFLPVCYSLTFVFSLALNSVVLLRSCRGRRRAARNASVIYMVNLAATDLMYGLSLPFLVASYVLRDRWMFGDFMCRLVRFLFYFNIYASIFFLTCISLHRYVGICHPLKSMTLESKRAVKVVCMLVWLLVFALTCPIFRFAKTGVVQRGGKRSDDAGGAGAGASVGGSGYVNCWDDATDEELDDYVPYGLALHLLGFFVPFVIIAWCYSQVVRIRGAHHLPDAALASGLRGCRRRPQANLAVHLGLSVLSLRAASAQVHPNHRDYHAALRALLPALSCDAHALPALAPRALGRLRRRQDRVRVLQGDAAAGVMQRLAQRASLFPHGGRGRRPLLPTPARRRQKRRPRGRPPVAARDPEAARRRQGRCGAGRSPRCPVSTGRFVRGRLQRDITSCAFYTLRPPQKQTHFFVMCF